MPKTSTKSSPRARKSAPTKKTMPKAKATAPMESKKEAVLRLLRRPNGASIAEIATETDWQPHSVRGFLTGTVKYKLELPVVSEKDATGERRYHIAVLKPGKE